MKFEDKVEIGEPIRSVVEAKLGSRIIASTLMNAGMTNLSYIITTEGGRFVLRINGKNTELYIDRKLEELVYKLVLPLGISDEVIMIDTKLGFKLSNYIPEARTLDINNADDIKESVRLLRILHGLDYAKALENLGETDKGLIFEAGRWLQRYEDISKFGIIAKLPEYPEIKAAVLDLAYNVARLSLPKCLCHIDPLSGNFLIGNGRMYLIDFEYSRISDPIFDIAMQAVYEEVDTAKVEELILSYYDKDSSKIDDELRFRVYYYIALGGVLWASWCEVIYVTQGRDFTDYQAAQLAMGKKYAFLARELLLR